MEPVVGAAAATPSRATDGSFLTAESVSFDDVQDALGTTTRGDVALGIVTMWLKALLAVPLPLSGGIDSAVQFAVTYGRLQAVARDILAIRRQAWHEHRGEDRYESAHRPGLLLQHMCNLGARSGAVERDERRPLYWRDKWVSAAANAARSAGVLDAKTQRPRRCEKDEATIATLINAFHLQVKMNTSALGTPAWSRTLEHDVEGDEMVERHVRRLTELEGRVVVPEMRSQVSTILHMRLREQEMRAEKRRKRRAVAVQRHHTALQRAKKKKQKEAIEKAKAEAEAKAKEAAATRRHLTILRTRAPVSPPRSVARERPAARVRRTTVRRRKVSRATTVGAALAASWFDPDPWVVEEPETPIEPPAPPPASAIGKAAVQARRRAIRRSRGAVANKPPAASVSPAAQKPPAANKPPAAQKPPAAKKAPVANEAAVAKKPPGAKKPPAAQKPLAAKKLPAARATRRRRRRGGQSSSVILPARQNRMRQHPPPAPTPTPAKADSVEDLLAAGVFDM